MKLKDLLLGLEYTGLAADIDVLDIEIDSRKVKKDVLFVCINGINVDGHKFYKQAIEAGACYIVSEIDLGIPNQIIVDNCRKAYAKICSNFFGNPSDKLKIIGVTGTNGKTTTTTLIKQIFSSVGVKVGLIGTIRYEIGNNVIKGDKTTPDSYDLQKLFSQMVEEGCEYVVMEVSSHALDQYRLGDTKFYLGIFTNLTQDHLDYHLTMENYMLSKKRLLHMSECVIVNLDDKYSDKMIEGLKCEVKTFSTKNLNCDFYADNISCGSNGVEFYIKYNDISSKINFCIPGIYSVENALAVAAACIKSGICIEKVVDGLNNCKGVRGRSEVIDTKRDFTVICDFAHTPDALENILLSIKSYAKGRIITLFGCGGDRDKTKRPLMGMMAAKYSDFLIVTSDNPRSEDPQEITKDIVAGVEELETPYCVIVNREEAIFYAINNAKCDDIILLAGKGHENYQVLKDEIRELDEISIVRNALDKL